MLVEDLARAGGTTRGSPGPRSRYPRARATNRSVRFSPLPPMARGSRSWMRRRIVARIDRREPLAVVGHGRPVEEAATDRGGLPHPVEPLAERRELQPERLVLPLEPAGSETQRGPAARRVVQGRRHLHEQPRVPIPGARDEAAHPRPAGHAGPAEQDRPALEDRAVEVAQLPDPRGGLREEVVVAPELVEAELVDVVADGHQLGPGHVLAPDLEPEAKARWSHGQTSDTVTTAPVRADSSAASMTRNPRTESIGSTGRSPVPRTASRKPS